MLAERASEYARENGMVVVWGRCYQSSGAPDYWPWIQVLRGLFWHVDRDILASTIAEDLGELARLVPELTEWWPGLAADSGMADSARFQLFESTTRWLQDVSHQKPLLIILDDLHWADRSSLLLLEFIAREIAESGMVLAGLFRDTESAPERLLAKTMVEVSREPANQRLDLTGLNEDEVARMVSLLSREETPPEDAISQIMARTGGNPFFVTELVTHHKERDGSNASYREHADRYGVSDAVRELIRQRLSRLNPACQDVLSVAAVIGREFNPRMIHLVTQLSLERVLDHLEEAANTKMIGSPRGATMAYFFVHDLIREAIYEDLRPSQRLTLHRKIGCLLESEHNTDLSAHYARIAHHFVLATPLIGHEPAVRYLDKAGEQAIASVAYDNAVDYFQSAIELLEDAPQSDDRQIVEFLLRLGDAQRRAGAVPASNKTFFRAASLARQNNLPEHLARAAVGMSRDVVLLGRNDPPRLQLLEEACNVLGPEETSLKAQCLAHRALALAHDYDSADVVQRRLALSKEAVEVARRVGEPRALATALHARHRDLWTTNAFTTDESRNAASEMVTLAEEAGDSELLFTALCWHMFEPLASGEIEQVDSTIERLDQLESSLRQPFYRYMVTSVHAMRCIIAGSLRTAEELTDQGRQLAESAGLAPAYSIIWWWVLKFQILRELDRLEELSITEASRIIPLSDSPLRWRLVDSQLALAGALRRTPMAPRELEREHAEVTATIDRVWESAGEVESYGIHSHGLFSFAHLAEAIHLLGDQRRAAEVYEALKPHREFCATMGGAFICIGPVSYFLGLLATTLQRWERAEIDFAEAQDVNRRLKARPFAARTAFAWADMLLRHGDPADRSRARSLLDSAHLTALDLHLTALQREIRSLRRRYPDVSDEQPPPMQVGSLTAREMEVLALIAEGYSNQEIANGLFIAVRTAENHVSRILDKLGVQSRTGATRVFLDHRVRDADRPISS